jgi:chromosome segregation ATPase
MRADTVTAALAELERVAASCRELQEALTREAAARRAAERARDDLLAELARRGAGAAPDEQTTFELAELRDQRHAFERAHGELEGELAAVAARGAALEAELEAARGELDVAEEERGCLEEQVRHLARTVALLTTENRLLRREPP